MCLCTPTALSIGRDTPSFVNWLDTHSCSSPHQGLPRRWAVAAWAHSSTHVPIVGGGVAHDCANLLQRPQPEAHRLTLASTSPSLEMECLPTVPTCCNDRSLKHMDSPCNPLHLPGCGRTEQCHYPWTHPGIHVPVLGDGVAHDCANQLQQPQAVAHKLTLASTSPSLEVEWLMKLPTLSRNRSSCSVLICTTTQSARLQGQSLIVLYLITRSDLPY